MAFQRPPTEQVKADQVHIGREQLTVLETGFRFSFSTHSEILNLTILITKCWAKSTQDYSPLILSAKSFPEARVWTLRIHPSHMADSSASISNWNTVVLAEVSDAMLLVQHPAHPVSDLWSDGEKDRRPHESAEFQRSGRMKPFPYLWGPDPSVKSSPGLSQRHPSWLSPTHLSFVTCQLFGQKPLSAVWTKATCA